MPNTEKTTDNSPETSTGDGGGLASDDLLDFELKVKAAAPMESQAWGLLWSARFDQQGLIYHEHAQELIEAAKSYAKTVENLLG
ncbi:MAG: hypothetical protein ACSHX0_06865 [Akkermansiaceae bacterium]